ncbi:MAG: homoserine O-succinyltransferase [Proteobacteria bacterium]|nr:homoserine O-succinyltransferase [Pseudomonadota bacterium]
MDPAFHSNLPVTEGVLELPGDWALHHGGRLDGGRIAWRLAGPQSAPVVCALGGIWCDRFVFDPQDPQRGCWREVVGPGRALDASRYRVLSFDYLGGRGESTGPQPGVLFPSVSTYDQAEALVRIIDHLGVASLHAILGGSYGGMVALAFAERYPERVSALAIVSAADRPHAMAISWHSIQRQSVRFAIERGAGQEGLKLARAVGLSLYRSPEEFAARFPPVPVQQDGRFAFPVERYLFADTPEVAGFSAEAFLCLSESLDLHRVDASRIFVPTTAVGAREDQLVPLSDVRALVARMGAAQLREISSIHGHDAYLREPAQLRAILAEALGAAS